MSHAMYLEVPCMLVSLVGVNLIKDGVQEDQ